MDLFRAHPHESALYSQASHRPQSLLAATCFSCEGGTDEVLSVWTLSNRVAGHKCLCCHSEEIETGCFPFIQRLQQEAAVALFYND